MIAIQMDGQIDIQIVRYMYDQIDRWIDGWTDICINGQIVRCMHEQIDRWMDGQIYGWVVRQIDGWIDSKIEEQNVLI